MGSDIDESSLLASIGLRNWSVERHLRSGGEPTWLVRPAGPASELLVVKKKRDYLSESEFLAHCAVHRRLADAGGPVPALPGEVPSNPVRGADGALYEMWEWTPGRTPGLAAPDLRDLGAALAEFHLLAASALDGVELQHQEPHDRFDKARFHLPLLAEGLAARGADRHRALTAELADARQRARTSEAPPDVVLHGDPCPGNVLLTRAGRAVLVDLDDVHRGPAVSDLAWSLISVGAVVPEGDGFRESWDRPAFEAVLEGYQSRRPLSRTEHEVLPCWIVASLCCAATDQLYDYGWKISTEDLPAECDKVLALAEPDNLPARSVHFG